MSLPAYKFGRTYHLPWSLGATDDDCTHALEDVRLMFGGRVLVGTEKVDGENTTIYWDGRSHARSVNSAAHPSRDHIRALAARVRSEGMPEGWRLVGENLFALHSIGYDALPGYFALFGVVDAANQALPWEAVEEWAALLGLPTVPVIYRGEWDEEKIRALYPRPSRWSRNGPAEGYVVRVAGAFPMDQYAQHTAKFVRANHVQTDTHWMHRAVVPNGLSP